MGQSMGGSTCLLPFGQYGSGVDSIQTLCQGPTLARPTSLSVFLASFYKFHYSTRHIPGVLNIAADTLSCMPVTDFSPFVPQIPAHEVPVAVMDLLMHQIPDWNYLAWTRQFKTLLLEDSPRNHEPPTGRV